MKDREIPAENMTKARAITGTHAYTPEEEERVSELRSAATVFIASLMTYCPAGADRQAAIRKVREALMTANSGIALRGTDPSRD